MIVRWVTCYGRFVRDVYKHFIECFLEFLSSGLGLYLVAEEIVADCPYFGIFDFEGLSLTQ